MIPGRGVHVEIFAILLKVYYYSFPSDHTFAHLVLDGYFLSEEVVEVVYGSESGDFEINETGKTYKRLRARYLAVE